MGNTESNNSNENYNKDEIERRRLKQLEIISQLNNQQNIQKKNTNRKPVKKNNHLDNIEVQNMLLKNKTMQKQFINKLNEEIKNNNIQNKKNNYNKVNDYLNNLDVIENDYDNNSEQLYINQGYVPQNKVVFSREDAEDNFKKKEKQLESEFKKDEKKRKQIFIEQQKIRRKQYESQLKNFDESSINPLELFQLQPNFNLDELKRMYKKLALVTHPDRPKGSEKKFQLVTKAYLSLLEKYKISQADKQYLDLRNDSKDYLDNQNQNFQNRHMQNESDFDVDLFNKIYTENKLHDVNDTGYEDWMKNNSYDTEEITQSEVFSNKFNLDIFNQTFQNSKSSQEVIKYEEPEQLCSSSINCTELGQDNISDFGRTINSYNELGYTDYKQAYTQKNILNPGQVKKKEYTNLEELKNDRSRVSFQMSEADARNAQLKEMKKKELEQQRMERLKRNDEAIFNHYSKVHKMFLKN